jgi:hypothetical protein
LSGLDHLEKMQADSISSSTDYLPTEISHRQTVLEQYKRTVSNLKRTKVGLDKSQLKNYITLYAFFYLQNKYPLQSDKKKTTTY